MDAKVLTAQHRRPLDKTWGKHEPSHHGFAQWWVMVVKIKYGLNHGGLEK